MTRGPDGRFVTDTGKRNGHRRPVPVTCATCGQQADGEIYLKGGSCVGDPILAYCATCRVPPGQFAGMVYDRTPERRTNCWWCGRPFRCDSRIRRYCTDLCRQRSANHRRQDRRSQLSRQRPCETCGHPFAAPRQDTQYCSPACRQRAYRQRQADAAAKRARDAEMIDAWNAQLYG